MEKESQLENLNLLYSQLLQQSAIPAPSGNGLSFIKKKVKGHIYWYLQVNIGNRQTQRYIGPDSPETQDKIELEKKLWKEAQPDIQKRKQLVAMLQAGGVWFVSHNEARVFELMERLGFFIVGGVLLGTYAFNLYQNMLNVRWPIRTANTPNEMDKKRELHHLKMGISNQEVNLKEAVFHSGYGFFEVRTFKTKETLTTYRFLAQEIQVEILTHQTEANLNQPLYLKSLNTFATPVKYLDFLLDEIQPAVMVARSGIRVNVPSPGRYALYQLVVSQQQDAALPLKANNALEQAEQLLSLLIEKKTETLLSAFNAAKARPDNFYSQMLRGIQHLPEGLQHKLRLNFFQNELNRTELNRTEQNRTEQNKTEQNNVIFLG